MLKRVLYIFVGVLFCTKATVLGQVEPRPNVVLICIDDLRPELNCYGKDYIVSPNIDALAAKSILFNHHYVNAPSCGPSRFTLLTGMYGPVLNGAINTRTQKMKLDSTKIQPSMPEWFKRNNYTTVAVGKVSHHPGGMWGKDWNDTKQKEMPRSWT